MIVPVMAISNLVLTRQIYSEETNGAHAHNRDHVPLTVPSTLTLFVCLQWSVTPPYLTRHYCRRR